MFHSFVAFVFYVLFYFILFYSILFYSVLFYSILFYSYFLLLPLFFIFIFLFSFAFSYLFFILYQFYFIFIFLLFHLTIIDSFLSGTIVEARINQKLHFHRVKVLSMRYHVDGLQELFTIKHENDDVIEKGDF